MRFFMCENEAESIKESAAKAKSQKGAEIHETIVMLKMPQI